MDLINWFIDFSGAAEYLPMVPNTEVVDKFSPEIQKGFDHSDTFVKSTKLSEFTFVNGRFLDSF